VTDEDRAGVGHEPGATSKVIDNLGWDERWNEARGDRDAVRIAAEHRREQ